MDCNGFGGDKLCRSSIATFGVGVNSQLCAAGSWAQTNCVNGSASLATDSPLRTPGTKSNVGQLGLSSSAMCFLYPGGEFSYIENPYRGNFCGDLSLPELLDIDDPKELDRTMPCGRNMKSKPLN